MVKLSIEHLSKRYWFEREDREVLAVSDVSLAVEDGEFLAIVGPSGCGKTTLLNIVAGLLPYEEGIVSIDGKQIKGPGVDRAVVFQHSSLLPWRTISGNVRYGMEMQRRFDENTMRERADHFVKMVGLSGFERHFPNELSGGMQQRVNLARGFIAGHPILLLDEPTASLDADNRAVVVRMIQDAKLRGTAIIAICHDLDVRDQIADRLFAVEPFREAA